MDVSFQHDDRLHENNLVTVDVVAVLNFPATRAYQHQPCAQKLRDQQKRFLSAAKSPAPAARSRSASQLDSTPFNFSFLLFAAVDSSIPGQSDDSMAAPYRFFYPVSIWL